jgi:hypothetical protein
MLKKSVSGVLASLRGSPYRTEYASPLHLLRPCWAAFLSILRGVFLSCSRRAAIEVLLYRNGFFRSLLGDEGDRPEYPWPKATQLRYTEELS